MKPEAKAVIVTGTIVICIVGLVWLGVKFPKVLLVWGISVLVYVLTRMTYTILVEHYRKKE